MRDVLMFMAGAALGAVAAIALTGTERRVAVDLGSDDGHIGDEGRVFMYR